MRGKVFAGALALSLWGGAALANGVNHESSTAPPPGEDQPAAMENPPQQAPPTAVVVEEEDTVVVEEAHPVMSRVFVNIPLGLEGYTGGLNGLFAPGFAWGFNIGVKPARFLGFELGYSGAANELDDQLFDVNGADMVRSGASVLATLGLGTAVEPYVLAGIGVNWQNFRTATIADDTNGSIPLGGGVRWMAGRFMADARIDYNILFADDMRPPLSVGAPLGGGRYTGTLSIGGAF